MRATVYASIVPLASTATGVSVWLVLRDRSLRTIRAIATSVFSQATISIVLMAFDVSLARLVLSPWRNVLDASRALLSATRTCRDTARPAWYVRRASSRTRDGPNASIVVLASTATGVSVKRVPSVLSQRKTRATATSACCLERICTVRAGLLALAVLLAQSRGRIEPVVNHALS